MNWEAIGAIGELLSAVVVIFSIFYLARQVRQGTEQTRQKHNRFVALCRVLHIKEEAV